MNLDETLWSFGRLTSARDLLKVCYHLMAEKHDSNSKSIKHGPNLFVQWRGGTLSLFFCVGSLQEVSSKT